MGTGPTKKPNSLEVAGHKLHECNRDTCDICTGGLAYCIVCKRGECEFWDDAGRIVPCDKPKVANAAPGRTS